MSFKFQPQGVVLLADRDGSGNPLAFEPVGCADDLSVSLSIDTFEHVETCSGQRAVDYRGIKKKSAAISLTLTDFSPANLVLALNGTKTAAAGSTSNVVAEVLPTLLAGQWTLLGGANPATVITALTIVDSTGSPLTLTPNTDYVLDATTGAVYFPNVTGYVQPFKASYTRMNMAQISMFTSGTLEKWVRFNAIDNANADRKSVVDLYRVRFDPTSTFPLLSEELAQLTLSGSIIVDDKKTLGGALGQFGRVTTYLS